MQKGICTAWEALCFNDGSRDSTGKIMDEFAARDPHYRVFHHDSPRNLGGCYKRGIGLSSMNFLMLITGDNECRVDSVRMLLSEAGTADMIIPFTVNLKARKFLRRWLSRLFLGGVNFLSGVRLRYYNGTVVHRTKLVREVPLRTDGFGYQAELLVKMARAGHTFKELGIEVDHREKGASKAFRWKNLLSTAAFFLFLAWDAGPFRSRKNRSSSR